MSQLVEFSEVHTLPSYPIKFTPGSPVVLGVPYTATIPLWPRHTAIPLTPAGDLFIQRFGNHAKVGIADIKALTEHYESMVVGVVKSMLFATRGETILTYENDGPVAASCQMYGRHY